MALSTGFTQIYKGKKCIGLYPIFREKDFKESDLLNVKVAKNYDSGFPRPGHGHYGPSCSEFLPNIEDSY
jgi:hypothetical protein